MIPLKRLLDGILTIGDILRIKLGGIHQIRLLDPGEGGRGSTKSRHLLLFVKEFYCLTRTQRRGRSENTNFDRASLMDSPNDTQFFISNPQNA